jgi:hypothetical protein
MSTAGGSTSTRLPWVSIWCGGFQSRRQFFMACRLMIRRLDEVLGSALATRPMRCANEHGGLFFIRVGSTHSAVPVFDPLMA